jgi:thiol-disulfide isomerase/thioredoxin
MKAVKSAVLIAASLLVLTSCAQSTPAVQGEVLACNQIKLLEESIQEVAAECLDGSQSINIAAIKGPAIINVWGSWCQPCKQELPYFSEYYRSMDSRIQLIGVDVEEKRIEDGQSFARGHGIIWPNLYDRDGSTRKYFGMGVPVTWFIDSNGKVLYKKIGPVSSADQLRSLADKYFRLR